MAQKNERTAFAVSNNLKTALIAKGIYPAIETAQSFYSGAANDIHLTTEGFSDGAFRTVNITANVPSFDFIDSQDPALSRIWSERELNILIGNKYFHSKFKSWSMRRRGNVQRNHMMRKMRKKVFPKNQSDEGMKSIT